MDLSMLLPGLALGDPWELAIRAIFMAWGSAMMFLAVKKGVEPLLLIPIGLGIIMANVPGLHLARYVCQDFEGRLPDTLEGLRGLVNVVELGNVTRVCSPESTALLGWVFHLVVRSEIGPVLMFVGIGALADFRPLVAFPLGSLIASAAEAGTAAATFVALALGFRLNEAMAIGTVGGADGPITMYTAMSIAPHLVGPLTVAVYSYVALVPLIQPPIVRALVPRRFRATAMPSPREVTLGHILVFWLVCLLVVGVLVPAAFPLVAAVAMGNIVKEVSTKFAELGRYLRTIADPLLDVATILTMLGVGATLSYDFLLQYVPEASPAALLSFVTKAFTILALGLVAFAASTAGGILFAWALYFVTRGKVNPVIGCAGVSAVPISARVAQREVQLVRPGVYVLYHALGPNVAGVVTTAVIAGFYISYVKRFWIP